MTKRIERLKTEARTAAHQHGHDLGLFHANAKTGIEMGLHTAHCKTCGAMAVVDDHGSTLTHGSAVNSACAPTTLTSNQVTVPKPESAVKPGDVLVAKDGQRFTVTDTPKEQSERHQAKPRYANRHERRKAEALARRIH